MMMMKVAKGEDARMEKKERKLVARPLEAETKSGLTLSKPTHGPQAALQSPLLSFWAHRDIASFQGCFLDCTGLCNSCAISASQSLPLSASSSAGGEAP